MAGSAGFQYFLQLLIPVRFEERLGLRCDGLFQAAEQYGGAGFGKTGDEVIQGAYSYCGFWDYTGDGVELSEFIAVIGDIIDALYPAYWHGKNRF